MNTTYSCHEVESLNEYIELVENMTKNNEFTIKKQICIVEELIDQYAYNDTMKKYFEAIKDKYCALISNDKKVEYNYFYRGHSSVSYKLIPSVFRGNNGINEQYFYHEMILRCPEHFTNLKQLDKLVKMQHYGCPTRLLDVTSNPLVALYFACHSESHSNNKLDGEVIIFGVPQNEILFFDSDRARILSAIARFNSEDKTEIYNHTMNQLNDMKFMKKPGGHEYKDAIIEKFYHEISIEIPSFKRNILPRDLLMNYVIKPNRTNDRIVKQDGAFIICGLSKNEEEAENKINALTYDRIIIRNKSCILKELEALSINKATLFPEIDKVAEYLIENSNK